VTKIIPGERYEVSWVTWAGDRYITVVPLHDLAPWAGQPVLAALPVLEDVRRDESEDAIAAVHALHVYATGLRIWYRDNEASQQISTDILFIIEKVGKK